MGCGCKHTLIAKGKGYVSIHMGVALTFVHEPYRFVVTN
jgi:hypothetical protein